MVVYKIKTFGRFGNNVIQLTNCISLALQTGVNTINFDFDGFHKETIVLGPLPEKCQSNHNILDDQFIKRNNILLLIFLKKKIIVINDV
jgi:hypothetical protein